MSVGGPSLALIPVANVGRREKVKSLPANLSGSYRFLSGLLWNVLLLASETLLK